MKMEGRETISVAKNASRISNNTEKYKKSRTACLDDFDACLSAGVVSSRAKETRMKILPMSSM